MAKIYIVTQGEYSDYHICKVFANKESAIAYCNSMYDKEESEYFWGRYYVEDYEICDSGQHEPPARIGVDAKFMDSELVSFYTGMMFGHRIKFDRRKSSRVITAYGDIDIRNGESMEEFEKRAKKIVVDKFYQYKARLRDQGK